MITEGIINLIKLIPVYLLKSIFKKNKLQESELFSDVW
jgi:hypothetical protein